MRPCILYLVVPALAASFAGGGAIARGQTSVMPTPMPVTMAPTMPSPTPDADQLAAQVRLLAVNPLDLNALVRAGQLAVRLDDDTAAAAFFARAERIDPRNARAKAGEGSLLVQSEQPGEALRKFAEAQTLGFDPRNFAADRGLAYDLIGEPERAQRDYRLALQAGPDDETVRRYALSLGISGKRERAFEQLDSLLRKSDRGAWRDRAFILAMNGDKAGAETIATTMMPGAMGQGLEPFFDRIASLSPADRAFAVHFGELRATPARIADARMIPPLPPLGPEPGAPVELASQTMSSPDAQTTRKTKKKHGKVAPIEIAVATPAPPPLPQPPSYGAARPYVVPPMQVAMVSPPPRSPAPVVLAATAPPPAPPPLASAPIQPERRAVVTPAPVFSPPPSAVTATNAVPARQAYNAPLPAPSVTPASVAPPPRPAPLPPSVVTATAVVPQRMVVAAGTTPVPTATVAPVPVPPPSSVPTAEVSTAPPSAVASPGFNVGPAATPEVAPPPVGAPPSSSSVAVAANVIAPAAMSPAPPPAPVRSEDRIIANIIAGVPVPGSELGVAPVRAAPPRAEPVKLAAVEPPARAIVPDRMTDKAAAETRPDAKRDTTHRMEPDTKTARSDAAERDENNGKAAAAGKRSAAATGTSKDKTAADLKTAKDRNSTNAKSGAGSETSGGGKSDRDKSNRDKPGRDRSDSDSSDDDRSDAGKPGKTRSGKAAKKDDAASDERDGKIADKKNAKKADDAKKKPGEKAEPSRIWVQVAGGATEDDLPKAWAGVKSKAGDAFKGHSGYTTPLRATNRVLTGPFKSNAEAQAFVNSLAKKGISGFTFTSDPDQKVAKLPPK